MPGPCSAAYCKPITLEFEGKAFGNPGAFNGAPNVFSLFHDSPVSGSMIFNESTRTSGATSAFDANSLSAYTFQTAKGDTSSLNYSYTNILPSHGIVQFYANTIIGGYSDVFTASFHAAPGSFKADSIDFADLGSRVPAWGAWEFQRHEFGTRQTVQYRGSITKYKFTDVDTASPPSEIPLPSPLSLLILGTLAFAVARRRGA